MSPNRAEMPSERSVLIALRSRSAVIGGVVNRAMIAEVSVVMAVAMTAENAVGGVRIAGIQGERSVSVAHRSHTAVIGGEVSSRMIAEGNAVAGATAENSVAAVRNAGMPVERSGLVAHGSHTAVIGSEVSNGMIAEVSAVVTEVTAESVVAAARSGFLVHEGTRGHSRAEIALRARVDVVLRVRREARGEPKIEGGDGSCTPYDP